MNMKGRQTTMSTEMTLKYDFRKKREELVYNVRRRPIIDSDNMYGMISLKEQGRISSKEQE